MGLTTGPLNRRGGAWILSIPTVTEDCENQKTWQEIFLGLKWMERNSAVCVRVCACACRRMLMSKCSNACIIVCSVHSCCWSVKIAQSQERALYSPNSVSILGRPLHILTTLSRSARIKLSFIFSYITPKTSVVS